MERAKLKGEVYSAKPYSPIESHQLTERDRHFSSGPPKLFRIYHDGFEHITMMCSDFAWDSIRKELRLVIDEVPMLRGLEWVEHMTKNTTSIELELRTVLKKPFARIRFDGALLLNHQLKPAETPSFCEVEHFVDLRYDSCNVVRIQEDNNDAAKIPPQLRERLFRPDGTPRTKEYGRD
jgi:hypothetical protein